MSLVSLCELYASFSFMPFGSPSINQLNIRSMRCVALFASLGKEPDKPTWHMTESIAMVVIDELTLLLMESV